MLYIKSLFTDSNGSQVLATIGQPARDLKVALERAKRVSIQRGVAEVVGQGNELLAAFRAGEKIVGSVLCQG